MWQSALFQLVCMTLISIACSQWLCPCAPNGFACFYLALWLRLQAIHYSLVCHVWALLSQTDFCSHQFYLTTTLFCLLASPPHVDIHLALRPRPLTAKLIFNWPHDECWFLFLFRPLTAKSNFYSPHSECQFLFLFHLLGAIFHSYLTVVRTSQPWWPQSSRDCLGATQTLHHGIHQNYQDHWMVLPDEGVLGIDGMPIR